MTYESSAHDLSYLLRIIRVFLSAFHPGNNTQLPMVTFSAGAGFLLNKNG